MKKFLMLFLLLPGLTFAWQPTKPVEAIIGFSPGSGNEISFRAVMTQVEKNTGIIFNVINKPGAGSAIANEYVSKDTPDGYHILIGSGPALYATDRIVIPTKKYGINDFTPALGYAASAMTIVAKPNDPVNNIHDFIKTVKSEPVSIGDPGSAARLVYELLAKDIKFVEDKNAVARIEYKGPADTLTDVIGGHVRFGIMPLPNSFQSHKAGKVKIIAVTTANPILELPGISTVSMALPGFDFSLDWGILLPKNTPPEVVNWYVTEFNRALASKEVQDRLALTQMFYIKSITNPTGYKLHLEKSEMKFAPLVDKIINSKR